MREKKQLDIINHLEKEKKRWFAVKAKYKAEKQVVLQLQKKNIDAYIPLVNRIKRNGKKVKSYELPLIYNYVFVCINKSEYLTVLEQQYVYEFVKQGKHLISIPQLEMDLLKIIVGDEYKATLINTHFTIGDTVEVIGGNLTGLTGSLIANNGKQNMLVELDNIGYQFQIEIDTKLLMKKDSPVRA